MISTLFLCSAISCIDVPQVFPRNICEVIDGTDRRGPQIAHMVPREEAGDVQGDRRVDPGEPLRFFGHLIGAVVLAWDDEGGDFDMADLRRDGDVPLDGLEIAAELAVPVAGEAFEVDVHGIDQRQERTPWCFAGGAVADEDVDHAGVMHEGGAVAHVFIADEGFVVGVGDADVAAFPKVRCDLDQCLRRDIACLRVYADLGDGSVLTERAAQVAAKTADGEDLAARMEAAQRLFFDGIQGQCGETAIVQRDDLAAVVCSCTAKAGLTLLKLTVVETEVTGEAHV